MLRESPIFKLICVFDCEEGGLSFTAAIPGVYVPLVLCLAEAPDLMGAMSPCPSKSSVCPDKLPFLTFQDFEKISEPRVGNESVVQCE